MAAKSAVGSKSSSSTQNRATHTAVCAEAKAHKGTNTPMAQAVAAKRSLYAPTYAWC